MVADDCTSAPGSSEERRTRKSFRPRYVPLVGLSWGDSPGLRATRERRGVPVLSLVIDIEQSQPY